MAEIKLQRKGPSGWLWLLGLAVVALFALALGGLWDGDDVDDTIAGPVAAVPDPDVAPTTGVSEPAPAEVAAFLAFSERSAGSPAGAAHEYAADGIRRLSRALDAVIEQQRLNGTPVQDRLEAFQARADRIQADPEAMQHAEQVRDVFTGAAEVMAAARQERWPDAGDLERQVADARAAATAIEGGRPLLDQTAAVKTFFDRAAAVLRSMSERQS